MTTVQRFAKQDHQTFGDDFQWLIFWLDDLKFGDVIYSLKGNICFWIFWFLFTISPLRNGEKLAETFGSLPWMGLLF